MRDTNTPPWRVCSDAYDRAADDPGRRGTLQHLAWLYRKVNSTEELPAGHRGRTSHMHCRMDRDKAVEMLHEDRRLGQVRVSIDIMERGGYR
jgi:hypothetical protein